MIWNEIGAKSDFFIDGRMSGEVLRVINAWAADPKSVEYYPSTLFAAGDAHAGGGGWCRASLCGCVEYR